MSTWFEVEYINHAWGFQHTGHFITSSGDVRKYDVSDLKTATNKIKYDRSQLLYKVSSQVMTNLCNSLKNIPIKELKQTGDKIYDAGNTSFHGYIKQSCGLWKKIPLYVFGTASAVHPDPKAKILASKIGKLIGNDIISHNNEMERISREDEIRLKKEREIEKQNIADDSFSNGYAPW
jgi:hypothetical protein